MSANNMSDEELDNLFRKAAEEQQHSFDPEAWAAMDRKLDGAPGWFGSFRRFVPILLLAVLVGVVMVWKAANKPAAPAKEVKVATSINPAQEQQKLPQKRDKREENTALPGSGAMSMKVPFPRTDPGAVSRLQSINPFEDRSIAASPQPEAEEPLKTIASELKTPPTIAEKIQGAEVVFTAREQVAMAGLDSVILTKQEGSAPADSTSQEQQVRERVFLKSITLSLLLAPDMTTVRFKDPEAVSANAGVLVTLPLTKRLRLVSGAVWANKLYKTEAAEYQPYPYYWSGKIMPDEIEAKCQVLDIPVNLQLLVLERGKNQLSVQAGLSSYLMLSEKYTYTYTHTGQDPYSKTRKYTNENRHWFGVQNVSVGYTRQLSPAFSIGAEPFVKIPLKSIGAGKVKLTSAGVFFTAGYTLR